MENDIVTILRDISNENIDADLAEACRDGAGEIEKLRRLVRLQDSVIRLTDAEREVVRLRKKETELLAAGDLLESQLFSVAKQRDALRLTDAEREAIERGYCSLMGVEDTSAECTRWDAEAADKLRGLLERTK